MLYLHSLFKITLILLKKNRNDVETIVNAPLERQAILFTIIKLYVVFEYIKPSTFAFPGNLGKRQPVGRLWRFSVMGDPTVTQFMIRDCDR